MNKNTTIGVLMIAVLALIFFSVNISSKLSQQSASTITGYEDQLIDYSKVIEESNTTESDSSTFDPNLVSSVEQIYKYQTENNFSELKYEQGNSTDMIVFAGCPGGYVWSYFGGVWQFFDGVRWFRTTRTLHDDPTRGCLYAFLFDYHGNFIMTL